MKTKVLLVMLAAMGSLSGIAFATTQSFNVQIAIRQAIAIQVERQLNFGLVDALATSQTLTIAADEAGTGTSGVGATSARFALTGDPGYPVTVSVTSPATNCDGANNLTFALTESTGGAATSLASVLPGTLVWVGGSVTVPANPATGSWTCSGTLSVVYN